MPYVVMIHATFNSKSDADHIYNQTMAVATNASVARIGEAGERTSHGAVYEELADGTLTPDRRFHIDRFGIVRDGKLIPDDQIPEWVQPQGAQDAYPLTDVFGNPTRVQHNGEVFTNDSAVNTQQPGVAGWLSDSVVESPSDTYPVWQEWTSGLNEDLYQIGDRVTHNGSDWEATLGNNYWEPGSGTGWVAL